MDRNQSSSTFPTNQGNQKNWRGARNTASGKGGRHKGGRVSLLLSAAE